MLPLEMTTRNKMDYKQEVLIYLLVFTLSHRFSLQVENISFATIKGTDRFNFGLKDKDDNGFSSQVSMFEGRKMLLRSAEKFSNGTKDRDNHKTAGRNYDQEQYFENSPLKNLARLDSFWLRSPVDNVTKRNESVRKIDHSLTWPAWSTSKKEMYNNRNRKNHKHLDPFEEYLGLDSKHHESSDRKYIHEHEGFFFPIPVPHSHHHEKEDHILIPLLLIILIPLLLFAIIIPLNANLLSTLFLIMQNNGVTTTTAQLAPGRRRKRTLYTTYHPVVEEKVVEMLEVIGKIFEEAEINGYI
ncbi:uncharacterized protein NPIL_295711 [Nephila pilipes]|uniref:Uncharacterized protein n=1 Tax=Nephila pilipes TaxID=299642 RepID=A0A8X6QZC8_NEPPI|nr:uncharacterized protein NPIL_295711 [Nephila pilipes]